MTLSAYFHPAEHQQHLGWIAGSRVDIVLDSAATDGRLLITSSNPVGGRPYRFTSTATRTRRS